MKKKRMSTFGNTFLVVSYYSKPPCIFSVCVYIYSNDFLFYQEYKINNKTNLK